MARMIICDVCDVTYIESKQDHHKIELNGKSIKVFIDLDDEDDLRYNRLDACTDCKKQALMKIIENI